MLFLCCYIEVTSDHHCYSKETSLRQHLSATHHRGTLSWFNFEQRVSSVYRPKSSHIKGRAISPLQSTWLSGIHYPNRVDKWVALRAHGKEQWQRSASVSGIIKGGEEIWSAFRWTMTLDTLFPIMEWMAIAVSFGILFSTEPLTPGIVGLRFNDDYVVRWPCYKVALKINDYPIQTIILWHSSLVQLTFWWISTAFCSLIWDVHNGARRK